HSNHQSRYNCKNGSDPPRNLGKTGRPRNLEAPMVAPIGERRNSGRAARIGGGWLLLVALTGCRMLPPPPCDSVARITIPRAESAPALPEIGPLARTAVLPASYEKEPGEMPEEPPPPLPLEPGGEPELVEPGGWRLEPMEAEALGRHPGVAAAAARVA